MLSITKSFEFHAAHHLPFHEGKCRNVHGHSYILQVEVSASGIDLLNGDGPSAGMVMDFSELKEIVGKEVLDRVDHKDLNDLWPIPTAEIMVEDIAHWIQKFFESIHSVMRVERVRLNETSNSYAEWRRED